MLDPTWTSRLRTRMWMRPRNLALSRTSLALAATALCAGLAPAEIPDTLWTRTYGGADIDVAHDAQPATGGGFILTGYTRSYGAGGHDLWLFKTDPGGAPEWNVAFGGGSDDEGHAVCQTADGGYAAAGFTKSTGAGGKDVWLVKVDAAGEPRWTRSFGGSSDDEAYAIRETADGGLILAGATSSFGTAGSRDLWLIKTDSTGISEWTRSLGGFGSDGAWSVAPTADGGFILAGWTFSYGPSGVGNAWLVKTDPLGNMEWNQPFGGTDVDRGYEALPTTDGGYILAGYTDSFGAGLYDLYLVKTDDAGTEQWSRTFGGTGRDYANDVVETADGGYLAAGYTLSFGAGNEDMYLVRTDANGDLQWETTFGGSASDVAYAVANIPEGGYVVAGHTLSSGAGLHDAWVIRLTPDGPSDAADHVPRASLSVAVRPNPFSQTAAILFAAPEAAQARLTIHDSGGRLVRTLEAGSAASSGAGCVVWDGLDQGGRRALPGIYWARLRAGSGSTSVKIVRR